MKETKYDQALFCFTSIKTFTTYFSSLKSSVHTSHHDRVNNYSFVICGLALGP